MRNLVAVLALMLYFGLSAAQDAGTPRMTQEALQAIIAEAVPGARAEGNVMVFKVGEVQMLCISDEAADRMRIIAPVKHVEQTNAEELMAALQANFHTVLDARYAISNGIIFAAYLHPLSSLSREQVLAAVQQVANARVTFGSTYSGGGPAFGGVR